MDSDDAGTEPADGTGLPASLELAWGIRDRPTKGPKRGLSLERILEAGVAVADADGLSAVSMSRVAAQLGASTMSLYRYVGSKDELLLLMTDHAMGGPPDPDPDEDWRAGLTRWAMAEFAGYVSRPWILQVPIPGPPLTPNSIAWMNGALTCMQDTGLGEWEKLSSLLLVTSYVRASAGIGAQVAEAAQASNTTLDSAMAQYARALDRLVDGTRLPAVRRMIDSGIFAEPDDVPDADFRFGLDRILDGLAAFMRSRSDPPDRRD